jgi:hypothetical protein
MSVLVLFKLSATYQDVLTYNVSNILMQKSGFVPATSKAERWDTSEELFTACDLRQLVTAITCFIQKWCQIQFSPEEMLSIHTVLMQRNNDRRLKYYQRPLHVNFSCSASFG